MILSLLRLELSMDLLEFDNYLRKNLVLKQGPMWYPKYVKYRYACRHQACRYSAAVAVTPVGVIKVVPCGRHSQHVIKATTMTCHSPLLRASASSVNKCGSSQPVTRISVLSGWLMARWQRAVARSRGIASLERTLYTTSSAGVAEWRRTWLRVLSSLG